MTRRGITRVATGGVLTAAAVAVLLLGSVIPFATFVAPCAAAVAVLYLCLEHGGRMGFAIYAAISVLALLLAADKELAAIFAGVLGYYPIVKLAAERLRHIAARLTVKLAVFNSALLVVYYTISHILVLASVKAEMAGYSAAVTVLLVLAANLAFVLYDIVLTRLVLLYYKKDKGARRP